MPQHMAWNGQLLPCSYQELKLSQAGSDCDLLSSLVRSYTQNKLDNLDDTTIRSLSKYLKTQTDLELNGTHNIFTQLHRKLAKPLNKSVRSGQLNCYQKFDRVKTVFCHTNFETDEVSAIYNVYFDQKGSFIVSGGDDGILKVWDRDTLTLQASLHGHSDYITEIDISKCNRFIASAGKDAQVIIWEFMTGKLLYKLTHHKKLVNCVKFFTPKQSIDATQQQYLFTCSDDGTVRLFDFTSISGWSIKQASESTQGSLSGGARNSEEDAYRIRRSQRQQRVSVPTSNAPEFTDPQSLFSIELTPDEFRPGTRNKKLDTLVINHQGVVVAGASSSELFIWRVNFDLVHKRVPKQDCYKFLGQFKMPRQSCVKFCEFNPKNGIAGVGDILMTGSVDGVINLWNLNVGAWRSHKESTFNLIEDRSRLILTIDEQRGCSRNREVQVRDSDGTELTEYVFEDIPSEGTQTKETYKLSKSVCDCVRWSINGRFAIASVQCQVDGETVDICRIKVWDTVEQTYFEDLGKLNGIRLPKNTFVLAVHPTQEEILMTGSDLGYLVLWNLHSKQIIKQFKQYGVYSVDANMTDNPLHGNWSPDGLSFIVGNSLGTISLYTHEDVAHQYEGTRVQQFFQYDIQRQTDNPFEKITQKPTICAYNMMPYEVQPERLLIRFTELDDTITPQKFQRKLFLAKELGAMEERYYQDQLQASLFEGDALMSGLPMESVQVSAIQPSIVAYDEDQDMSDLQIVNQLQNQQEQNNAPRPNRPRLQRNNQRLTSSAVEANSDSDESNSYISENDNEISSDSQMSDSESLSIQSCNATRRNNSNLRNQQQQTGRNGRPIRAARPVNLRDIETIGDELSVDVRPQRDRVQRSRRIQSSSDDEDQFNHRENLSNRNQGQTSRRIRRGHQELSSEIEVNGRQPQKKQKGSDDAYKPKVEYQKGSFYLSEHELQAEAEDKDNLTSHMQIVATKHQNCKPEWNYDLDKTQSTITKFQSCCLCNRTDGEIIGPFTKRNDNKVLYLHKDCIEVNTYSYFNLSLKKWVNIDSMMKHLVTDAQYKCFRCDSFGASVSCSSCGKDFHGYYCAGLYLLPQQIGITKQGEGTNYQYWQCLFCYNQQNFEMNKIVQESQDKDTKQYLAQLKKIDKSHLICEFSHSQRQANSQKAISYMPQIDDVVCYFYQGHEDYIYQYNCHFYAGQSKSFPKNQMMPWLSTKTKQLVRSQSVVLCKVESVTTLFPSERSLRLIAQYGQDSSEYVQSAQMIQRIELQFLDCNERFYVDLFPNELPDFLVLYSTFFQQQAKFRSQSLIGKQVTVRLKSNFQKMKIKEESPVEAQTSPLSLWKSVVCEPVQQIDTNQRRMVQSDQEIRINFWDIVFEPTLEDHGFNEHEHQKLKQFLSGYMVKNKEYLVYFKERVQEKIAPEYRQIIPSEMWFDLLFARLQNHYYRSQRQFFADLQLIATNAALYNGPDHEVAIDADALVKRVRIEAMKFIDCSGDRQLKDRIQHAIKLAAYNRTKPEDLIKVSEHLLNEAVPKRLQDLEESKDEVIEQVGQKRRKRIVESAELESNDSLQQVQSGARTLRKRQRNL